MKFLFGLLILSISSFPTVTSVCCPFPAFSFSAVTNVPEESFKCSEPISVTCQFVTGSDTGFEAVGISGNVTNEEGNKPVVLKKGASSVSASLTCNTSSGLWKVDKLANKYGNVGCIAKSTGGVWIVY
ncbi:hypothetical protein CAEBREN_29410 [Caenorhabditis brenneri]|uniref:C6 domain-containing protein n=1 Tax=Caenorhabditis brenneri TaxID=135651 RepID=G0PG98_CAEBE|nr:hypothetical protein CAEBREN_29410 [Caenorhabditis brenneri]